MRTPSKLIGPSLLALFLAPTAFAAAPPAMTVAVHPVSGVASSYFTLSAPAGGSARAGTIEVRNRRDREIKVRIDPVGSLTATTLGSAYAVPGRAPTGPARWIQVSQRRIVLAPHARTVLPVRIVTPEGAQPGDYLGGISVEAIEASRTEKLRGTVAVANVQRYAVGVFVKIPGPRHPLIKLPGADIAREPVGLTFHVHASNPGNVILQNVRGSILVTRGKRTVARTAIGPGTFVTGTSIDYPLLAPREQPNEGAVYRVRAVMRYAGGIARLDTRVRFGHHAAQQQEDFGGPPIRDSRSGTPMWLILAAAIGTGVAILLALVLVLRRRTPGRRAARRALKRASADKRPVALVRIADSQRDMRVRKLAAVVRGRLRAADRLYRLGDAELLAVMPDTHKDGAMLLCSDLRRLLAEAAGPGRVDITAVEANGLRPEVLLERLRDPVAAGSDELDLSVDSFTRAPR